MPVYAYGCKDCGHAFDIRQSFSDDALTECPQCGGALRKKFNTVGVVFKGSGFYRTDSRENGSGSSSAAPSSSGSSSGTSSGAADGASSSSDSSAGSAGSTPAPAAAGSAASSS
ncbi:FmdB family transcriptional regulator [Kocuria flava]|uniref:FmdB family zinc ribbon protein n=1 Tax=Kocuria flava TaxID=446860 RepID=UPI001FF1296B|nr:FmdB family zinc ribbon protein [Kocuria flava]MCJ8505994.1 FmdB family transcriptional regulator [Kocuria flava]